MEKNKIKKQNIILPILICIVIVFFILQPEANLEACLNGVIVWGTAVLPALFPFFIFTKLLIELNFVENISKYLSPLTKKLFHTPGIAAYIYTMSVLSGYPVGAKLTADFYEKGLLTEGQAIRVTTFTSTSGPLFIIGTVGIGMFHNQKIGLIILGAHFISALLNGLIYRNYKYDKKGCITTSLNYEHTATKNMLEEIMLNSIKSIMIIGGYIALFFVLICIANEYYLFTPFQYFLTFLFQFLHIPTDTILPFLNGLIEITKGCLDLSNVTNCSFLLQTTLATIIISFGGFSIHMQALTFIKKFNIKISFYLLQKTTHAILSGIIAVILCLIFK